MVKIALGALLAPFILVIVISPLQAESLALKVSNLNNITDLLEFARNIYEIKDTRHDTKSVAENSPILFEVYEKVTEFSEIIRSIENGPMKTSIFRNEWLPTNINDTSINGDLYKLAELIKEADSRYLKLLEDISKNNFHDTLSKTFTNQMANPIFSDIIAKASSSPKKDIRNMQYAISHLCDRQRSPQQFLYGLYNSVMLTQAKEMFTSTVIFKIFEIFNHVEGLQQQNVLNIYYQTQIANTFNHQIFEDAIHKSNNGYHRCDPAHHIRGQTFLEFERLTHNVIMKPPTKSRDCAGDLNRETFVTICRLHDCQTGLETCYGTLENCELITESAAICLSEWKNVHERPRLEWFRDKKANRDYGNASCIEGSASYIPIDPACRCTCFEHFFDGKAKNFVSMREVTTNMNKNMVVTGIKFIDTNDVVQLKIQTGILTAGGDIKANSTQWRKPEEISYDKHLSEIAMDHVFRLHHQEYDFHETLENYVDVAILNKWNRTFNLDSLNVPPNHVITGVKLSAEGGYASNKIGRTPLQLKIRSTPFHYETGQLDINATKWLSAEDMSQTKAYSKSRVQVHHEINSKNPVDSTEVTVPNFTPNQFIALDSTSFEGDLGQTVIPLLDAQPVAFDPPAPLTGISLFHKAAKGYGGFLSFRISTMNTFKYMTLDEIAD